MARYTRRVQTLLTDEQYQMLSELAERQRKPVSVLIREAVEQVYSAEARLERRRAALAHLLSLNAPVADWEQMEDEILQGHLSE